MTPDPPPALLLPFGALLLGIACGPLLAPKFWEHHLPKIVLGLGAVPVAYYLAVFHAGDALLHVAEEYVGFMAVIGALFVISGGVHLRVKGEATPLANTVFLLCGALLSNVIGTTGASMLLIRPWIRMNKYRFTRMHVAFFIFVISNLGGCLTPIGDPPLLLGYIKGVPFWWVIEHCWQPWCIGIASVLLVFYILDWRNFRRAPQAVREVECAHEEWHADGLVNIAYMAVVLVAIIALPAGWRELAMVAAAASSWFTTKKSVHEANRFSFEPVREVAWVFLGIFATMKPVLDYVVRHADGLGLRTDAQFYWLTGLLSGVLDNAPTYLTFLAAAFGLEHLSLDDPQHMHTFVDAHGHYLIAISVASVFFGALTYIGNAPNLMVKALCDHAGVRTPSFFGYVFRYSLPVLIPIFAVVGWLFFRA
jgi:Na+/H+ antiporter NhaD/arsenite permease-like protein